MRKSFQLGTPVKRRTLATQRFEFRKPQTEKVLRGVFMIFAPIQERERRWICEFEAPGLLDGSGQGYGLGPLNALAAACAHITYLLDRAVDVSTPLKSRVRAGRRK